MNRFIEITGGAVCIAVCLLISSASHGASKPAHPGEFSLSQKQKAGLLLNRGKYDEALEAYKFLLRENAEDNSLYRGIVKAYSGIGLLGEAEDFIKDYLSNRPGSSAGHYGLGYFYYLQNDDSKARNYFEKAIRLDEGNALAWNNLGASLSRTKSYALAVKSVKEAIRLAPSNPMYYNNLRLIFEAAGKTGLFFAEYQQYVRKGKNLAARGYGGVIAKILRQEAFKAYSQGNLDESIEKFSAAAGIYSDMNHKPGLTAAFFGLGVLYEEQGETALAQKYYKKILSINPDHLQAREKVK